MEKFLTGMVVGIVITLIAQNLMSGKMKSYPIIKDKSNAIKPSNSE